MQESLKHIVHDIGTHRSASPRDRKSGKHKSVSNLQVPKVFSRSKSPNDKTWSRINSKFKTDQSWRRSPSLSNRSISNVSLDDMGTSSLKKDRKGNLILVNNKQQLVSLKQKIDFPKKNEVEMISRSGGKVSTQAYFSNRLK